MIAWIIWFFVALPLFLLDGWLVRWLTPVPPMTFAVCLFAGLYARPSALPGLLLCAALARSVLVGGDAALHVLILGLPVAALVPFRVVFYRRNLLWQGAAAAFLALTVPKVTGFLGRFAETVPQVAPVSWTQILTALFLVPASTWVLCRVPPLSLFVETME